MGRREDLLNIYYVLYRHFGPQHWWPGDTPFEVVVGAILTQNTAWTNVEKAINSLKTAKVFSPEGLYNTPVDRIASLIRSSGYYNIKAKRLRNFLDFLFENFDGKVESMMKEDGQVLRKMLLEVNGLGLETVDSILLYACNHPVFVVDAYTRRIFSRHGYVSSRATYQQIQELFMGSLPEDPEMFNEYHALIVRVGKELCRKRPLCGQCPVEFDLHKKNKDVIK